MRLLHHPMAFARLAIRSRIDAMYYYTRFVVPNWRDMIVTRRLRGTERGRSAFVFAAGPSMRRLDPHKIRALQATGSFHVFGINHYASTSFGDIAPADVYVISDPAHWTQGELTDADLLGYPRNEWARRREESRAACARTWEATRRDGVRLFVPIDKFGKTEHPAVFGFCDGLDVFSDNVSDITRPLGLRPLTAYKALAIACFLGYDRIYICGIDNDSWLSIRVDDANRKHARYEHFYDTPDQIHDGANDGRLSEGLFFTALTFASLEKFSSHPIVNLDPTSLVDCFPKQHELDVYRRVD